MSRAPGLLGALAAGIAIGWLLGAADLLPRRAARPGGDPAPRATPRRAVVDPPEVARLRIEAERARALEAENAALRERLDARAAEEAAPGGADEELPPGTRRPDGTIVGGARWQPMFVRTATGFVEQLMSEFLAEAGLTPEQERRLRDELHLRIGAAMQVTADYTNGDLAGGAAYERMAVIAEEGRARVLELMDDRQAAVYRKFERELTHRMHAQVVHAEMVTLGAELGLDADQEAKVRAAIGERWARVQKRLGTPVPNVMFKPIRRAADADIYRETADDVRAVLDTEQRARFDREERTAAAAIHTYRSMLVPRDPDAR